MRLHEQVPFEEWICMSLAAMFTRYAARILIVPVKRAQIKTLSDVLDLMTHPTSLVLAYDCPIQVRHCSRLYASFFSLDPEQPSGELFELFFPTLWRHFSFTERFREWSSRVRRCWHQNTSGNFLFLAIRVGAHSELAHLLQIGFHSLPILAVILSVIFCAKCASRLRQDYGVNQAFG
jgi:hypothetical protein